LKRALSDTKELLLVAENELQLAKQQLVVWEQKQQLGEIINFKYIKAAEKSKTKQKALKLHLKTAGTG
jgi:hypothetical protein